MSYGKSDYQTQEKALNNDDFCVLEILSSDKPSLYLAIREKCIQATMESEEMDEAALSRFVSVPEWYEHGKRDIGTAMRSLGFAKSAGRWKYGEKPTKVKKRPTLHVTRNQLRRLSRAKVCAILEMCEQDLARRDRMKEN